MSECSGRKQYGKAMIDGSVVTNLRFANGVDALAEEELELEALLKSIELRLHKVHELDQC